MRKIILVSICVFIFFLAEFFLFNTVGRLFVPNLLLLLIIYFNLAFGIRYSIFAAVCAGVLKDSFGLSVFGFNIFSFVLCAYSTTFLKKYFHYIASRGSRLLLVFCIVVIHFAAQFCLQMMFSRFDTVYVLKFVFVPEMITTLLVASFVFIQLRKCVSRLFV